MIKKRLTFHSLISLKTPQLTIKDFASLVLLESSMSIWTRHDKRAREAYKYKENSSLMDIKLSELIGIILGDGCIKNYEKQYKHMPLSLH